MPVVLHAVVHGLTHSPAELRNTVHPRVGRIAVAAWTLSLLLGIVTYLLLNHLYSWERVRLGATVIAVATPTGWNSHPHFWQDQEFPDESLAVSLRLRHWIKN